MNSEQLVAIAEVLLVVSVLGGFFLLVLILTFLFPKIAEVESRIATPGKQLDGIREIWGNGPIGRWMRVVHVYFFFIFRNLPRIGPRIESRMGDEAEALPMGYTEAQPSPHLRSIGLIGLIGSIAVRQRGGVRSPPCFG